MEIVSVAAFLAKSGYSHPALAALNEGAENYVALLMQPEARICASKAGVRNSDPAEAKAQFDAFLALAVETGADLVVTPEYSTPWAVMIDALRSKKCPGEHAVWMLGCESITRAELLATQEAQKGAITFLFEDLPAKADKFLDPLVFVFHAVNEQTKKPELVALVQFKTSPMGDKDHFERSNLQLGNSVYCFGSVEKENHLVGIICSDAFDLGEQIARQIYSRSLVVHIQLNPEPRNANYRQYREQLFRFSGGETEVLCLNWAKDACEIEGTKKKDWKNNSCSAWYSKSPDFDRRDQTIADNHVLGLYYTWLEPCRVHATFFNFSPAAFLVETTKVAHRGVPGPQSNRRGPQLRRTYNWAKGKWASQAASDDGFALESKHAGKAEANIKQICAASPIAAERVLALSAGTIKFLPQWFEVTNLDSCKLDASEVIKRVTFCQDNDSAAANFREIRLRRSSALWDIVTAAAEWPKSLTDFEHGFALEWHPNHPHRNAISASGERATIIYMGGELGATHSENIYSFLDEELRRQPAANEDERLRARQRLAVWYRDGADLKCIGPDRTARIDRQGDASSVDFTRSL